MLELIVKRGRALVDARARCHRARRRRRARVDAAAGEYRRDLLGARSQLEGTIAAAGSARKRSHAPGDVSSQLRFALGRVLEADRPDRPAAVPRPRARSPLRVRPRAAGEEFSKDDERLLEAFAASAATAVATAQEFAAHGLRRSIEASERERQRWARELHDQTLQDLGALRVRCPPRRGAARRRGAGAAVDEAVADSPTAIDELRAIITDLRPAALDELGTGAALEASSSAARRDPVRPRSTGSRPRYERGREADASVAALEARTTGSYRRRSPT